MYVLLIFALLGAACVWTIWKEEERKQKIEWLIYGLTALLFLIRFSIGQDIGGYAWMFERVQNPFSEVLTSHMMRNVLYTLLNYLVKITFGEFRWFVLLSNVIILGLCTWVIRRHSRNPVFSMFLFIGSGMLEVYYSSGLKQGIAMALYLFAFYEFLPKKKYLLYELFILLALGFQEISVVLIPIPLFLKLVKPFQKHPYRMTLIISAVAWILAWFVNEYLIYFEYMITDHTGYAPVWTHLLAYFHRRSFSYAGSAMEIVFLAGILLLYHFADKKDWKEFRYLEIITFAYSCVLYFLCAGYSIMSRTSDMIQIILLVLVPNLVHELPALSKKAIAFAGLFALNAVLLYTDLHVKCVQVSENEVFSISMERFPYVTVFEKERINAMYPPDPD